MTANASNAFELVYFDVVVVRPSANGVRNCTTMDLARLDVMSFP